MRKGTNFRSATLKALYSKCLKVFNFNKAFRNRGESLSESLSESGLNYLATSDFHSHLHFHLNFYSHLKLQAHTEAEDIVLSFSIFKKVGEAFFVGKISGEEE